MTDTLRAFTVLEFAVQPDSLFVRELLLLEFELRGQIEQTKLLLFFGNDFIQEGKVVAEKENS